MNDWQLISQYVNEGSEAAFRSLVNRHVNLVHATAMRRVREPNLAEEVTQAVFVLLARKALTFRSNIVLPGWLYRTTNFVAANVRRTERRRQRREQEALQMQQQTSTDESWRRLAPVLDDALEQLRQREREAIILRFFQEQSLREVGALQGTSEEAARKRVVRALEKLRSVFAHRGVSVTTMVLAASLSRHGAEAAPAELAATVAQSALVHAGTAAGLLPTLVQEALAVWRRDKARSALLMGAGAVCVGLLALHRAVLPPPLPAQTVPIVDAETPSIAASVTEDFPSTTSSVSNPPPPIMGLLLEGETEYRFYSATPRRVLNEQHGAFALRLDRFGRWQMSALSTMNVRERFVSGFDGANNFRITYTCRTDQYPGSPEMTEAAPLEEWHHGAAVSPGAYPFDVWPTERFVWFALASGTYLSQAESAQMPAPWGDGRTDLMAYVFTNELEKASSWPDVPIEVRL